MIEVNDRIAVIYARYSSAGQRDVSIEQQVTACMKYAEQQELQVLKVYDDHAMTGTNDNRPGFQQMIKDSAIGAWNYVIVYTLDRFSRNKYDSAIYKQKLKEHGVKVLSAMEHITDDPSGALMESILEGFAEYYSLELAQKIKRGNRSNAEKCYAMGRLPLGYRKGADRKYEIVPEEALIVQEIFERVANHEAFADIFRDLNARGIPTKYGKPWDRSSLSKMLANEKYIGVYEFKDTRPDYEDIRVPDGIPRIISDELFAQVQEYVKVKPNARQSPQKRRRENSVYLLTGKVYCGLCGEPMIGISGTSKTGDLHHYYVCKQHRKKSSLCSKKPEVRDTIEELVAMKLQTLLNDAEVMEWLADGVCAYILDHQETDEMKLIRERLSVVTKQKENTKKAIMAGMFDEEIKEMFEKLKAEESSLKAKYTVAESRIKKDITPEHVLAFVEEVSRGDIRDKKYQELLIDMFLVKVYIFEDHLKLILNFTGGTNSVEVPTGVVDAFQNLEDLSGTDNADSSADVRISSAKVHESHLIRTQFTVYLIEGLVVMVTENSAKVHA